jgi:hypothetical protein
MTRARRPREPEVGVTAFSKKTGHAGPGRRIAMTRPQTPVREEDPMIGRRLVRAALLTAVVLTAPASPALALEVGQKAPDFVLAAPGGKQVKLGDLLGKGPVVLYTFIGAFNGP